MVNKVVDLVLIYQFIKRLVTPFNKTEAYKLGLIDEKGKRVKKPETPEEEKAYGYFDRLVFNIKKLIERVPGGKSKLGSYAAALFLIRESDASKEYSEQELIEGWMQAMDDLEKESNIELKDLMEDAPANVTGTGVVGTGDDPVHWKKMDARKKDMKAFLKRYMMQKEKRRKIKERKDFLKQLGL
jgi:hypothetical protein